MVVVTLQRDYHLATETLDELRELYDEHPAWGERDREDVKRSLQESDEVVGVRDSEGDLVACARVLTDYQYYAMVYDVIVAESRRRQGIGSALMETVVTHFNLQGIDISLNCREELVPFYEECGFVLTDREVQVTEEKTVTYRIMTYQRDR